MSDGQKQSASFDPMQSFRDLRDAYLDAVAKTMVEAVNTEAYAEATGTMLREYLTAAAPFREAMEKSMTHALEQLSLPSRQEVAALAERFSHVEMKLDDTAAQLERIESLLRNERAGRNEPAGNATQASVSEKPVDADGAPGGHAASPQPAGRGHERPRNAARAQR